MAKRRAVKAKHTRSPNRGRKRAGGNSKPWEPGVREMEMFHLYTSGAMSSYEEIGKEFGIGKARVCHIFTAVKAWLMPRYVEDIRGLKVEQTESLLHIFGESMRAWERSKENGVSETVKDIEFGEGKIPAIEKSTTTKGQCGDPRFLAEARAALEDIRDIWGANAPVKIEHSGELRVAGQTVEEANQQLMERMEQIKGRLLLPSVN